MSDTYTAYTTQTGDTLSSIALAYYGDVLQAANIASENTLANIGLTDVLPTGTYLTLANVTPAVSGAGADVVVSVSRSSTNWWLIIAVAIAAYFILQKVSRGKK